MKFTSTKEKNFTEKATLKVFSFCCKYIDAIGYDAQREILEVRLRNSPLIRRYANVPEEIWYQFRESAYPDIYYRRCICGQYPETSCDMRRKSAGEHSRPTSMNR